MAEAKMEMKKIVVIGAGHAGGGLWASNKNFKYYWSNYGSYGSK